MAAMAGTIAAGARGINLAAMIVGVVLAGGQGRRLGGGDKVMRRLGAASLLDAVVARLAPQVAGLALSANGDPARFARFGLAVLADAQPGLGPLAGMLAGLRWARAGGATQLLVVPGDTPFLPADLAIRLGGADVAHAASGGRDHWAVALVATSLADDLAAFLGAGGRAPRDWLARHGARRVDWDAAAGDPFQNVNTPADLAAAVLRWRGLTASPPSPPGS